MSQKKEPMNYRLLAVLIVPVLFIFGLLFYMNSKGSGDSVEMRDRNVVPIPEEVPDKVPETKIGLYEQMKKNREQALVDGNRANEVKESDFISMALNDEDPVVEKKVVVVEEPKPVVASKPKTTTRKVEKAVEEPRSEEPKVVYVERPVAEETKRGGMGIIKSGSSVGTTSSYTSSKAGEEVAMRYFPAILEESMVIKPNSSVVFLLMEDMDIGGTVIKKNSYLFGKANNSGRTFDIKIEEVKNTDGRLVSLREKSFYVYDEKYSKGLPHEGDVNEAVRDAGRETSRDVSGDVTGSATGTAANLTLRAIDRTVQNISRKKEATVSLSKGYKVYIKQENM
jgi:hypothetical protein